MSYQNVGTPRFYVNTLAYLNALGLAEGSLVEGGYVHLNPTQAKVWNEVPSQQDAVGSNDTRVFITGTQINNFFSEKSFLALLGHNLHSAGAFFKVEGFVGGVGEYSYAYNFSDLINDRHQSGNTIYPDGNDGFTMSTFDGTGIQDDKDSLSIRLDATGGSYTVPPQINSAFLGTYYDMPNSPDLSLKLSFEYDGVKTIQTRGGATLSNATYTKPADWGNGGAWQLGQDIDGNPVDNLRSGRRVWDLSFSYISDSHLMPMVAASSNIGADANDTTLLDGTDFFSQVWNRTLAGHLPFIFQANNSNNSPDQFSICRFDMDALEYDQVAHNVYNVKLKIREVW